MEFGFEQMEQYDGPVHVQVAGTGTHVVRAWGGQSRERSHWAGFLYPESGPHARGLWNLPPGNTMGMVTIFRVSPGTKMYVGRVAGGTGMQAWVEDPGALQPVGNATSMSEVRRILGRRH